MSNVHLLTDIYSRTPRAVDSNTCVSGMAIHYWDSGGIMGNMLSSRDACFSTYIYHPVMTRGGWKWSSPLYVAETSPEIYKIQRPAADWMEIQTKKITFFFLVIV